MSYSEISSETLLEAIAAMPVGFALFDADWNLMACNDIYAECHHTTREEIEGASLPEIAALISDSVISIDNVPIKSLGHLKKIAQAKFDTMPGDPWEVALEDGSWYLTDYHPTKDGCLVSTWVNITAQKKIERETRVSQARLEDAIQSVPDIFALYDEDRRLIVCNEAYATYQRKEISDLIGSHHADNVANSVQYIKSVDGSTVGGDTDGYVSSVTPHPNQTKPDRQIETVDGRILLANDWVTDSGGVVFVARDITELQRAQNRFRDAVEVMPASFGVFRADGTLRACNTAYTKYHRRPREELIGRHVDDIIKRTTDFVVSVGGRPVVDPDEANSWVGERIQQLSGRTWEVEMEGGVWYQTGYHSIDDGGFVSVSLEVSDYKRLQQEHQRSEDRMDSALEAMSDIFALYDSDLNLVACNSAYSEFAGLPKDQALGMNFDDLVARTSQKVVRFDNKAIPRGDGEYGSIVKQFSQERTVSAELELKDGSVYLANDWKTERGGQIFLARDITALKSIQTRFEDAIEAMPQMFCLWDSDLRLVTCNSRFAAYFGRTKEEIAGKSAKILSRLIFKSIDRAVQRQIRTTPDDPAAMLEWLRAPANQVAEYVGVDGQSFIFTVSPSADGGAVMTGRNITELRRAEDELNRQQEALAQTEKLSALGTMLAGVAHELNNPLSVVVGQTLLMKETAPDESVARRAEVIGKAADRCARIVKSFLAMARQNPTESLSVDLNEIVSDTLEVLKYNLSQSSIYVDMKLAETLPAVWGDPDQLGQIVLNLVVNAQHALEEVDGDRTISVCTSHVTASDEVLVRVEDNGPGVPDEIRNRVFEPFFTTKEAGSGTGLGLALARKTVESHRGSLTLEEADGGGSVFVLRLPAHVDHAGAVEEEVSKSAPQKAKVLIVDDEVDVILTLTEILEGDGHEVVAAGSGQQALSCLAGSRFDAILTDLRMKEMDGPRFYQNLQDDYPGMLDHIGFVTGDSLSEDIRTFLASTNRPTVEKPFGPEDIRTIMKELV